jgi:hypothetical protein
MNGTPKNRTFNMDRYAPDRSNGYNGSRMSQRANRSPLSPLGMLELGRTPRSRYSPGSRQPQQVFFSNSNISDGPCFDDETVCDTFELVNVTVVIYRVTGVVCELESAPKRRSTFGIRDKSVSSRMSGHSSRRSGVTTSLASPSVADGEASIRSDPLGETMTTAVVSYRRNTYSNQTALETFLPSIPISSPSRYVGMKHRFQASWPSDRSANDESAIARSSVVVARCMKQEASIPGVGAGAMGSNYVHEKIELQVHLSRGTEIVKLGTATVVVSGEEEGERLMFIPIRPSDSRKEHGKKHIKKKSNKHGYFSGDKSRRYYLDDSATMRIGVRIRRQASAEEKERNENHVRNSLKSGELKKMVQNWGHLNISKVEIGADCRPQQKTSVAVPSGLFQNLFSCGGVLCAMDASSKVISLPDDVPKEIQAIQYANLKIESNLSSVSESTDGSGEESEESEYSDDSSDESDEYIEPEMSNFQMIEPVRRYT